MPINFQLIWLFCVWKDIKLQIVWNKVAKHSIASSSHGGNQSCLPFSKCVYVTVAFAICQYRAGETAHDRSQSMTLV